MYFVPVYEKVYLQKKKLSVRAAHRTFRKWFSAGKNAIIEIRASNKYIDLNAIEIERFDQNQDLESGISLMSLLLFVSAMVLLSGDVDFFFFVWIKLIFWSIKMPNFIA